MTKMARTVLLFKLAATEAPMTAQSGLVLYGELIQGVGFHRWLEQEMPKPGSQRGYGAVQHVLPFIWMLTGGGRALVGFNPPGVLKNKLGILERNTVLFQISCRVIGVSFKFH